MILNKSIRAFNTGFNNVIQNYSFIYIPEDAKYDQNEEYFGKIKDSKVIVVGYYEESNPMTNNLYFLLSFKRTILMVNKNANSFLTAFFQDNSELETCFLSNAKTIFDENIKVKYKEIESNQFFNIELSNFDEEFCLIRSKSNVCTDLLAIVKTCISSYLIKQSYIKLNANRIKTFSIKEKKSIKLFDTNEYVKLRLLGSTDSSLISLIYHIKSEELLTIKTINYGESKLFKREINNYLSIEHPLIPKYYGKTKNNDLVIEFINGKTLINIQQFHFNDIEKFSIIFQLISVIRFIHTKSFIYRDLKPDNLMIDQNKNIVLIDFDRMLHINDIDEHTKDFASVYSAPEIQMGILTEKSDIFSIGQMIFYIINEKTPVGENLVDLNNFALFPELKEIYEKCTFENFNDRISMSELVQYLYRVIVNRNILLKSIDAEDQFQLGLMFKNSNNIEKYLLYILAAATQNHAEALYKIAYVYNEEKYFPRNKDKFIFFLSRAADQNHLNAQYDLGCIYLNGEIVEQNIEKAIHYFKLAADQNDVNSQFELGCIYYNGKFVKTDIDKAIHYYSLASDQNDINSQYNLGMIYSNNKYVTRDIKKAIHYFSLAADQNNSESQYRLGMIYYKNKYIAPDINKAIHYFSLAADQNHLYAQYHLGSIYLNGEIVEQNVEKAIHYFKLASDKNDSEAQYRLGLIYLNDKYNKKDINKAIHYLQLASDQNHLEAQYRLGLIYLDDNYNNKDINKAIHYLQLASDQNHLEAQYRLGLIYLDGNYNKKDINKAIHYLSLAADQNHLEAQYRLGLIYFDDNYNKKDTNKGIHYLSLAADKKHLGANYGLGFIYYENEYVPCDIKKAIHHLTIAAEEYVDAQFQLGLIYYINKDVLRDINKAIKYFLLASKQNDKEAQCNLGLIYYDGIYVVRDILKAIHYFSLAAGNNCARSQYYLGLIYIDGEYIERNIEKSIHYFLLSSKQNFSLANYYLGCIYYEGEYVRKDIKKTIHYLSLASDQNHPTSQNNLGYIYYKGHYVRQDINKSIYYYSLAAKNNFPESQYILGLLYCEGDLVQKDINKGIELIIKSSNNKYNDANFSLGFFYHEGKYLNRDIKKAVSLYKEASSFNVKYAKNNLGILYKNGFEDDKMEIPRSSEAAKIYFIEAVKMNDPVSMYNLSHIYIYEEGTDDAINEAIKLLIESFKNNFRSSLELLCLVLVKKHGENLENIVNDLEKCIKKSGYLINQVVQNIYDMKLNDFLIFNKTYQMYKNIDFLYDGFEKPFVTKNLFTQNLRKNINSDFYDGFGV